MAMSEFLAFPWRNSHPRFRDSSFNIRPAPEFSTGEVVLSSLYRASGFDISEKKIPSLGTSFSKGIEREQGRPAVAGRISGQTWRTVVDRVVQSPKVAQQSSKRYLSLSPVVPDAT